MYVLHLEEQSSRLYTSPITCLENPMRAAFRRCPSPRASGTARALVIASIASVLMSMGVAHATTTRAPTAKASARPIATRVRVVIPAASAHHAVTRSGGVGVRHAVLVQHGHHRGVVLRKVYAVVPERQSIASQQGLRLNPEDELKELDEPLDVKSSVALVVEDGTQDVLFSRNTKVALPIASITKLMTALVVLESHPDMEEPVTVTTDDLDTEKFSSSRLAVGSTLSRRDMLHLALMSSENRAAHALARNYPGGLGAAIIAMNAKARALGMTSAEFHDPTGLTSRNVASAEDLAKLVNAASANPTIREFSTDPGYNVAIGRRNLAFHNTNSLVASPAWDIIVQKTGYISEAGKCLVMKAVIEGRSVVIVLLDSFGKFTRLGDANRIQKWMQTQTTTDPIMRVVKKTS
jgi:serine-type D-Ala-D-Ala endopeptidase (penicillin-binding protein 7)